jgi:hypothetical protein
LDGDGVQQEQGPAAAGDIPNAFFEGVVAAVAEEEFAE